MGAASLWISLVVGTDCLAPSRAFQVLNPKVIDRSDRLDLVTLTFDGIDELEPWRFHHFKVGNTRMACEGEVVQFLGFPGDAVRLGAPKGMLHYSLRSQTVSIVSHTKFVLHAKPGTLHHVTPDGEEIGPQRFPGMSGAPVFRTRDVEPELIGIVCDLSSSGLGQGVEYYEMSDG
ncbi:MAG: hypothetical protein NT154_08510, partial [Verrucomicrobia bacterium]|nr:hypothetical protein [Verrucomicrobiota bacterium]